MAGLLTMPHIPSSYELGYMGSMQKSDGASPASNFGRHGDTELAHVAPGEVIVPPEVILANPEVGKVISDALTKMGADPNRYVVGSPASSLNPYTGQPEFFLGGIGKLFKKISKSAIGKIALQAIAATYGGPAAAAAVGAATTKVSGGSWGQAIGAGIGSYAGANIGLSGLKGTVGDALSNAGLSSVSQSLPGSLAFTNLSSIGGAFLGEQIGSGLGALVDPPKISTESYSNQSANTGVDYKPAPISTAIPDATATTTTTKGSGVESIPTKPVSYLSTVKDRDTGEYKTVSNDTFSSKFSTARRGTWGSGVQFI